MAHPAAHANFLDPSRPLPTTSTWRQLWLPAIVCLLLLCFEIYLLVYDFGNGGDRLGAGSVLAHYQKGIREVRIKPSGTLSWNTPRDEDELYVQDSILTLSDSSALVAFIDDTEIKIEPNSLVILEKVPSNDAVIAARLVRGSIIQTKKGRKKLTVRFKEKEKVLGTGEKAEVRTAEQDVVFSSAPAEALRWNETIPPPPVRVESEKQHVETKPAVKTKPKLAKPKPKKLAAPKADPLHAPKLHKPKIKIQPQSRLNMESQWQHWTAKIWDWMLPSAEAKEKIRDVVIQLEWEPMPQAAQYVLQISFSSKFKKNITEEKTAAAKFDYKTFQSDKKRVLYFRVAAIDVDGKLGEFSAAQILEIDPIEEPATPVAKEEKKNAEPKTAATPTVTAPEPGKKRWKFFSDLGFAYHHRSFKSSERPKSVNASGFIPAGLEAEARAFNYLKFADMSFGFFTLIEKTEPNTVNVVKESKSIPFFRVWANLTWEIKTHTLSTGLSVSNTYKISLSGRNYKTQLKMLVGPSFDFILDSQKKKQLYLRASGAVYAFSSLGLDLNISARAFLPKNETDNWFVYRGPFAEIGILSRFLVAEISYGAIAKVGYAF